MSERGGLPRTGGVPSPHMQPSKPVSITSNRPVHMNLYATWEVDRSSPSCVPRLSALGAECCVYAYVKTNHLTAPGSEVERPQLLSAIKGVVLQDSLTCGILSNESFSPYCSVLCRWEIVYMLSLLQLLCHLVFT
ncbi:hypothetical protein ATANTOWER_022164 [Ataeniobius toweri]|uniref:Uncharacterized protein n=1 Tax=Ataeniobius toweri TaxID=208326 RepID=A0ABU7CG44_9TELE|nr:hypothetical protein [Ataeniobius toweri]